MRILIVGAGAMGTFFATCLSQGNDVILLAKDEVAREIVARPIRVSGKTEIEAEVEIRTNVFGVKRPDAVIICTKAYDTASAMSTLAPLHRRCVFLTLQNGLGNAEALAARARKVVAGVTSHGVTFVKPGEVIHAGIGDIFLGPFQGTILAEAERAARAFSVCGLQAKAIDPITPHIWTKAAVNAGINPVASLARGANGIILERTELKRMFEDAVREAARVAVAEGVDVSEESVLDYATKVLLRTRGNRNSMLQDLERGRRTEIDQINGEIVRRGGGRGVPTPTNEMLVARIKELEASGEAMRPP